MLNMDTLTKSCSPTIVITANGGQRTKRSVYSVTMHVHARAGAAHLTLHVAHVTHARCVAILAKAASAFLRSRQPAKNGYG